MEKLILKKRLVCLNDRLDIEKTMKRNLQNQVGTQAIGKGRRGYIWDRVRRQLQIRGDSLKTKLNEMLEQQA
jgi:hypothetical protein